MRGPSPLFAAAGLLAAGAIALLCTRPVSILAAAPAVAEAHAEALHAPNETIENLREPVRFAAADEEEISTAPVPKPVIVPIGRGLQCAQYARMRSGLTLAGDAARWWYLAAGRYKRDRRPEPGAVMVMGGTRHGHVAVVVELRSKREVLVDHANWMNRGEIQMGALVRDVSPANDWSQVRVWYPPINDLGNRAYPVFGFILNEPFQAARTPTQAYASL